MTTKPSSSTNNGSLHEKLECLKGMLQRLRSKADDIQNELQNEELQARKKRKSEVTLWLKQVISFEGQVQSIETEVEQVSFFHRGRLSNKLDGMKELGEQLLKQSEFPRGLLLDDFKPEGIELVTEKMEGSIPSRVQEEVWRCFERGECRVAIFGIGGVGKTTLAMHINNEILKQKRLFECVYYVTVSRETSVHKLQSDIAKAFNHSLKCKDEKNRAADLRGALAKREKSLLILDDVWEDIKMEEVGVSVEGDGCKLLITTRDNRVCRKMKCFPVHMKPLSTDECLDLFKKQLGNFETLPDEAKVIAALVAEECDGLPLGIVTMAGSMRGETNVAVWRDALRELRNPCSSSHDMENKVFRILKYSYDRLKKEKNRKCFLYCALYPEDCEIEKRLLVRHFIAVGLLDGTNRKESIDEGHAVLNVLENASLLERVEVEGRIFVKMHDLLRDIAIRIMDSTSTGMVIERKSLKEKLGKEEWICKDLKWVSIWHNEMDHIEGMMPDCPNISALFLRDDVMKTISNSFFAKMISLKVLDLSDTYWVEVLPSSISDLFNLNALLLCKCHGLLFIPSLAKLTKLRELNLYRCFRLLKLPEGMEELASLEHLDLRVTGIACRWLYFHPNLESFLGNDKIIFPPEELMRLNHLKILTGVHFKVVSEFKRCVDLGVFNQLETYHVSIGNLHDTTSCCEVEEKIDDDDTKLIKAICLNGVSGGEGRLLFPQNVSRLEFRRGSFSSGSLLGDFPSLVNAALERILTLDLHCLEEFSGLIREGVVYPNISFSGLRVLRISCCPKLKKLWMMKLDLPNLEEIAIADCGQMEEIFATEEGGIVKLPRLHSLELEDMPELRSIWGNCEIFFPHLISLVVRLFPKMKKIGRVSRNMSSLKTISISNCKEMEEIFAAEDEAGDDQIHLPKLEELELDDLPQLRSISRQTIVCNSLQRVSISATVSKIQPELENCPISVPSLSASGPLLSLSAYDMPIGWWESLRWNDPATLSNFQQLNCFSYFWNLSMDESGDTDCMDEDSDNNSISITSSGH